MKPFSLIILLFICQCSITKAQYFEWINSIEKYTVQGHTVVDLKLDKSGNAILLTDNQGCSVCHTFSIKKYNSLGDSIWEYSFSMSTTYFSSIAIDKNNNVFIVGRKGGVVAEILNGILFNPGDNILIKVDLNGLVKWTKNIGNVLQGFSDIECDNSGNIYLTQENYTEKRNYKGDFIWSNPTIGGKSICTDGKSKFYIMNENTITKINGSGTVIWSKSSYNGKRLYVRNNGNSFILNGDSLVKLNFSGNLAWIRPNTKGVDLSVDSLGRAVIVDSNSVFRINSTGTTQQWIVPSINCNITKVILNGKGDAFLAGDHLDYQESILCPFRLNISAYANYGIGVNPFISKLNITDSIPFQAGIFTQKLTECQNYGKNYLCTEKYYSIGYSYCTNSVSNFGPGNQFLVELLGGPVSPLIMGTAGSFLIPKSIPKGTNYQLRVSSTNPVITGYPNLPDYYSGNITINPTIATITALGNTTFCQGGSVQLKAGTQFEYNYAWLRNDTLIYPQGMDSIITADLDGIYKLITIDKWCSCTDTATIAIDVIPPPPATITASGPLSFCAGDSVILTANSGAGLSYQWKVNNVNIPFAFYQSYKATQAGTYKVKVTNSNGCSKISSGKTVSIICKDGPGTEAFSDINVYPNPFYTSFTLEMDNETNLPLEINIYDLSGRLCEKHRIYETQSEIELGAELERGFYMIEFSQNQRTNRVKVLKE